MEEENVNFVKKERTKKILEDNTKEVHNIFDGMNEDEFTKRSRIAIRKNLFDFGMEDPEEELGKESKMNNLSNDVEKNDNEFER